MGEEQMRFVIRKSGIDGTTEFSFNKGPIHIGRHTDSHIFLADRSVSRHHAVVFDTPDGKWFIEDLNSANKTFLNDKMIQKVEITDDCVVRIADFLIEVSFEQKLADDDKNIHLDDTLTKTAQGLDDTISTHLPDPQVIIRRLDLEHAQEMKLPAARARDFMRATEDICKSKSPDEMINALLDIANSQFSAFHSWCALRDEPTGSMTTHSGRRRDGVRVQFSEIKLNDKITEAIEKKQFVLLPRLPVELRDKYKINSAMIGPVVSRDGCYGVLYIDNDLSHEHYSLSDLDYMVLLSIHTAAILKNF
jgi:pSer/pThr/pTyr-binding forkhead associated (FHA) protein